MKTPTPEQNKFDPEKANTWQQINEQCRALAMALARLHKGDRKEAKALLAWSRVLRQKMILRMNEDRKDEREGITVLPAAKTRRWSK